MAPPPSARAESSHVIDYKRFLTIFFQSQGAAQILIVSTLFAIGTGSVLGLIPATLADRYARINHGFTDDCRDYDIKPPACRAGSDDAQSAAAWSHVALSALLLLINPVVGSLSDVRGRRPVILFSLALSCIPAAVFLLLLQRPNMHPVWYYASNSLIGSVNYLSIIFAALSDVVPPEFRAPSYGLLLSGFYGGFALAPSVAVLMSSDSAVALFSFALIASSLVLALLFLPETLPDEVREQNLQSSMTEDDTPQVDRLAWFWHAATRPLREISILNRDWAIRLLTIGSFFAAMVFAADATLVIYYIEETLDVKKADIVSMTLALGVAGILIQGGLLQPLIARMGEKGVLIMAYVCGTLHNFLYGAARSKETIYVALIVSQLTKTNFPILSSMASKGVEPHEQGRVQGALFATNAIGNAIGPLSMEFVYHHTKNKAGFGPGFMFIFASGLYAIGTIIVSFIPVKGTDEGLEAAQSEEEAVAFHQGTADLEEPLLNFEESTA